MFIQNDIFDLGTEFRINFVINAELASVDDAHGHARLNGMIEKDGVNRFAYRVVATKRE